MAWRGSLRIFDLDDARTEVTLEVDELPWPLRFYFLVDMDEDGTARWVDAGYELGIGSVPPDPSRVLESDEVTVTPTQRRWVEANLYGYKRIAEAVRDWDHDAATKARTAMRVVRERGRQWTPEEIALIHAEHEARGGVSGSIGDMAEARGVHRSTIWRARKNAQK